MIGFSHLPDEVKLNFLYYLSPSDLVRFGITNKRHSNLIQDKKLWRNLLDKHAHNTKTLHAYQYEDNPHALFQSLFSDQVATDKARSEPLLTVLRRIYAHLRGLRDTLSIQIRREIRRISNSRWQRDILVVITFTLLEQLPKKKNSLFALTFALMTAYLLLFIPLVVPSIFTVTAATLPFVARAINDFLSIATSRIMYPYRFYCHKSYLTFPFDLERSSPTEKQQILLAANAGVEANNSWRGLRHAYLSLPAWTHYRAFVAGKIAA